MYQFSFIQSQSPQPPPPSQNSSWTPTLITTLTTNATITSNLTELGTAQPQLVFHISLIMHLWSLTEYLGHFGKLDTKCTYLMNKGTPLSVYRLLSSPSNKQKLHVSSRGISYIMMKRNRVKALVCSSYNNLKNFKYKKYPFSGYSFMAIC